MKIEPGRFPRRSYSQVAAGCYFGIHFGLIFEPPEPLKIMLSLWRGAIFRKNGMTRPGAQNGAQNDPNRAPNDPQRLSNSPKDNSKSALGYWSNFSSILDDFGGSKMTPKSMLKPLSAPNGRLETSRAPFGEHLGSVLVSFEALGANFRACWVHVGFIFELCLQAPRPPALITPRTYFLILSSFP